MKLQKFKYFKVLIALFEILRYKLQGIFGRTIASSLTWCIYWQRHDSLHKLSCTLHGCAKIPPFYQSNRDKIKIEL